MLNAKKFKLLLLGFGLAIIATSASNIALGQGAGAVVTVGTVQIPVIGTFLVGGVIWAGSGWFRAWRKHLEKVKAEGSDPEWKGFDRQKLKDDVLLGTVLGLIAFGYATVQGSTPVISDLASFLTAAWASVGTIAIVDKVIIGGILNK